MTRPAWHLLAGAAMAVVAHASPAAAQTVIAPDKPGSAFGSGTTASTAGHVTTIEGGTRVGGNLFHSFQRFSLDQGDSAVWTTAQADTVHNVINRVTGGSRSIIEGKLDSSAIPNASFFFINPAGIVFGKGASVNVGGAAHFTTAQQLRFDDGTTFSAFTAEGSRFTVAAPDRFGFVGRSGAILMNSTRGQFAAPSGLDLVARDVSISQANLTASALRVAAVGSAPVEIAVKGALPGSLGGAVSINASRLDLIASEDSSGMAIAGGYILMTGSRLDALASEGALNRPIRLAGQTIRLRGSTITTTTDGAGDAGRIDMAAKGALSLDGSRIESSTEAGSSGTAGGVYVQTGSLKLANASVLAADASGTGAAGSVSVAATGAVQLLGGSLIRSDSCPSGQCADAGDGGSVTLTAQAVRIDGASKVSSRTWGSGKGGVIRVTAQSLDMLGHSFVSADTLGTGAAGSVVVDLGTGKLALDQNSAISSDSCLSRACGDAGPAGNVTVSAGIIALDHASGISSKTFGNRNAGNVTVRAADISLENASFIASDTLGAGKGGSVFISASDALALSGASRVSARTRGRGDGGDVTVRAGAVTLDGSAVTASSNTKLSGRAGSVDIAAGSVVLTNQANVSSDTEGRGDADLVRVAANSLILKGRSRISSDTSGKGAAGGNVRIDASTIRLENSDISASSDAPGSGNAGSIRVTADSLFVAGPASNGAGGSGGASLSAATGISSSTSGRGAAGPVSVTARSIVLTGNARISSDTAGRGHGNLVQVVADSLALSDSSRISAFTLGPGDAGSVVVDLGSGQLTLDNHSDITSDSCFLSTCEAAGKAGDVTVTAGRISLDRVSGISSKAYGNADAGNVTVNAAKIGLGAASFIASDTLGAGTGGQVIVTSTGALTLAGKSRISARTRGTAAGGNVTVRASEISLDRSSISASSEKSGESGKAGAVLIEAQTIRLSDKSKISSDTAGSGSAQSVVVNAGKVSLADQSRISSLTTGAGAAGNVTVRLGSGMLAMDGNSVISSDSCSQSICSGNGHAGDVTVSAGDIRLDHVSGISSKAYSDGAAGNVLIRTRNVVARGKSFIASDGLGTGEGGTVHVSASTALLLKDGSRVSSRTSGRAGGGGVAINAGTIRVEDSRISTSNTYRLPTQAFVGADPAAGAAGAISLTATDIRLLGGAVVSSDSLRGPAGRIAFHLQHGRGFLAVESKGSPSQISTSSGPGKGGQIVVDGGLALISNGAIISALGDLGGANVKITSRFLIQSVDRSNQLLVDGVVRIDSNVQDLSSGLVVPDIAFVDSSSVLSSQCRASRESGQSSQLSARSYGPFVPPSDQPASLKVALDKWDFAGC